MVIILLVAGEMFLNGGKIFSLRSVLLLKEHQQRPQFRSSVHYQAREMTTQEYRVTKKMYNHESKKEKRK